MEVIANTFLFLSALLLLINLTPRDLFSYYKKQKEALRKLKSYENVLGNLPAGVNIQPENSGMSLIKDTDTFSILCLMVQKSTLNHKEINWENIVGIGYSKVYAPVGIYKVEAIRPLYVAELPFGDQSSLILKPIGILDDFEKWFITQHTSFVNLIALIFLLIGFLLQLVSSFC